MNAANSQTVRQIESTLHQHAQEVIDELIAASHQHPFAAVVEHATMWIDNNDATRVLSRSTGTIDRLVADVARAAYHVFLNAVRDREPEVDADGVITERDRGRVDHYCRMRVASI